MDVYVLYDIIPSDCIKDGQDPQDILGVYQTKEAALEKAKEEILMEPEDQMEVEVLEDGNYLVSLRYDLDIDDGGVHKEPFYYIVKRQLM